MKRIHVALIGLVSLFALASCTNNERACVTRTPAEANVDFVETPYTDSLKFAQADSLEGKKFAGGETSNIPADQIDHVGYVSLLSCTDGDTANFTQVGFTDVATHGNITIKTRFLGINTPESTAKVEPWGKKASNFTKHKLEAAQAAADTESAAAGHKVFNIALVNDVATFGERDSSGNRWLAFVWYRDSATSPWRCLNLELVEQAYSRNQLFLDSAICDYRSAFENADNFNKKCGYRVYGEIDDGFDYSEDIVECNLWYVLNHYDEIGISEEGSSGKMLHILAQVVGIQGDSLYLRDVIKDDEQEAGDSFASLYCYSGYNSSICSILQGSSPETDGIGVVVYFYARATTYSNNIQLSDLQYRTTGKRAFRVMTEANIANYTVHNWADLTLNTQTVHIDPSTITSQEDFGQYKYQWIDTDIVLRTVTPSTDDSTTSSRAGGPVNATNEYWVKLSGDPVAYTYYAKLAGTSIFCNLRADASLNPQVTPGVFDSNYGTAAFNVTDATQKTFHVTGYLVSYFDKYQIQLANNYQQFSYIQEVIG